MRYVPNYGISGKSKGSMMPDWKPGDIANGHVLGEDLVWRPVQGASPPAPTPAAPPAEKAASLSSPASRVSTTAGGKSGKRWILPTLVGLVALFVGIGIGASSEPDIKSTSGLTVGALDDRESDLRDRAAELDDRESDLDVREAEVTALEEEAKKNTVEGDGNYEVGVDMEPGTWKNADRGDSCYWAINSDANGNNIVQNDNGGGPQTLTLKEGQYLQLANDCGTWKKID